MIITVENLTKEFKMNKKYPGFKGAVKSFFSREYTLKKAVEDISFTIAEGEIVGYIGANGAGKSTTIKMMTGILTPTKGRVLVNGVVPYEDRQKNAKDIGVVFGQKTQLWWDLPLSETFSLLKDIYEVEENDYNERMAFLNEVLELEEFLLQPVRTLSLGQRMRGDLAAALIHNPKVIYLDEPTIGLDVVVKENVRKAIKKINETYGTTIILTTHDLMDIEELSSRILIIDKGKLLYDGNLEKIKEIYGAMADIVIVAKEELTEEDLKGFSMLGERECTLQVEGNQLKIHYNKTKISSTEILKELMGKIQVSDFTLKETSIEDIVKKIYRNEV